MQHLLFLIVTAVFFIGCTSNEVALVTVNESENFITTDGETVLKENYEHVYVYNRNFIKVQKDKKVGMVNFDSETVLEPMYDSITALYNGYATITLDNKVGLLNEDMEIILEPKYDAIEILDDMFIVKQDNKFVCMDDDMQITSKEYDYIYYFVEGYARVEDSQKFGFIDESCEEVTEVKYEYVSDFFNGYAKVKLDGKYTFINDDLEVITQHEYESANFFEGK